MLFGGGCAGATQATPQASGGPYDVAAYDALLHKYVRDGRVDYQGLRAERTALNAYVQSLAGVDSAQWSRNERMALFINAYNAATLLLILEHLEPGFDSIKDIPSRRRWKHRRWVIGGHTYSLDDIEHRVLRPEFRDARVHAAINCASIGCPDLRAETFAADRLDEQLDDQARRLVNHPRHVRVRDGHLYVSKIFKWFAEDFTRDGGSVLAFVLRYADHELRAAIDQLGPEPKVKYLDYDWSLNVQRKANDQ